MKLALNRIHVGKRLRPVNPARVAMLVETPDALDQPITVRPVKGLPGGADHQLVAGAHRLAAAHELGRPDIEANVRDFDATEALIAEIDENLNREELTALDRAVHLAARKRAWDELHPERRGGDHRSTKLRTERDQKSQDETFGFSETAAAAVGLSRATIFRAIALVEALGPELIAKLQGTATADNASELKAIAQLTPARRERVAEQLVAGTPFGTAMKAAGAKPAVDTDEQVFRALVGLWSRTGAKVRKRFLAHAGLQATPDGARTKPSNKRTGKNGEAARQTPA